MTHADSRNSSFYSLVTCLFTVSFLSLIWECLAQFDQDCFQMTGCICLKVSWSSVVSFNSSTVTGYVLHDSFLWWRFKTRGYLLMLPQNRVTDNKNKIESSTPSILFPPKRQKTMAMWCMIYGSRLSSGPFLKFQSSILGVWGIPIRISGNVYLRKRDARNRPKHLTICTQIEINW